MKTIAVLIPCYNEEVTIRQVIQDFKEQLPESKIYVYDNNSSDNTYDIAKSEGAEVRKEFNQGKGYVVRSMFSDIDADIFIMVDGDDTYPAKEISGMLSLFVERNADMLVGDRLTNNSYFKENKRPLHSLGNRLVRGVINVLFSTKLNDIMSGYRIFSKKFVKSYPVMHRGFEIETDMTIFALHNKLNLIEFPITFKDRPEGSTSKLNTFQDGFKVLMTILNMFRLYKPIVFFSLLSAVFLILGLATGFPVLLEYVKYQYIYKLPSAILAVGLIIFSLLLLTCGFILDAIVRVERKNIELQFKRITK